MRFGLGLAISVSVLLITVASWTRFGQAQEYKPGLVTVTRPVENSDEYYKEIAGAFLGESNSTTTKEELTSTDIIGRQLLFDYVELATNGKATDQAINDLVGRYIESIPTIVQGAPQFQLTDLQTVPNNTLNYKKYSDEMTSVILEYERQMKSAQSKSKNFTTLGPDFYVYAKTSSSIYAITALNIKKISVPNSLAILHLRLINNYFHSSNAMKYISEGEEDSSGAFAGIIVLNEYLDNETLIITDINKILSENGV